jgi:lipopolysaccharide export system permease protein
MLLLGVMLSTVAFTFNDYFLPLGNIRLKTMLKRIIFRNPGIELESYSVKKYENTVIITGSVKGNIIENPVIIDRTEENKKRIITAETAYLEPNPRQRGAISLRLEGVRSHVSNPAERGSYEYGAADKMIYNILLKNISVSMVNPGPAEQSSVDVWQAINNMKMRFLEREQRREENLRRLRYRLAMEIRAALSVIRTETGIDANRRESLQRIYTDIQNEKNRTIFDRKLQSYLLEFQRKFASPLSCLAFIIFAFPVGLFARRSGRAVGFGVGIIMSGIYWGMLLVSYRLGARMSFSPVVAMWAPNILVLSVGVALILRRVKI